MEIENVPRIVNVAIPEGHGPLGLLLWGFNSGNQREPGNP